MRKTDQYKEQFSSAATKLLSKRKELYEAHDKLEQKREEFRKEQGLLAEREKKVYLEDEKIQSNLDKFCQFIKKNESKKQRAEQRIQFESAEIRRKEEELRDLEL